MSREIKFRVWDGKEMHYPEANYSYQIHWSKCGDWRLYWVWGGEERLITDNQDWFLLFTGLRDKNGVEIYDGDIVSRCNDTQRSEVEFALGCFISMTQHSGSEWCGEEILCNKLDITEVIGNIYENPELLNE